MCMLHLLIAIFAELVISSNLDCFPVRLCYSVRTKVPTYSTVLSPSLPSTRGTFRAPIYDTANPQTSAASVRKPNYKQYQVSGIRSTL